MLLRGEEREDINVTVGFIIEVIGHIYSFCILFLSSYFLDIEHVHNSYQIFIEQKERKKRKRRGRERKEMKERRGRKGESRKRRKRCLDFKKSNK